MIEAPALSIKNFHSVPHPHVWTFPYYSCFAPLRLRTLNEVSFKQHDKREIIGGNVKWFRLLARCFATPGNCEPLLMAFEKSGFELPNINLRATAQ